MAEARGAEEHADSGVLLGSNFFLAWFVEFFQAGKTTPEDQENWSKEPKQKEEPGQGAPKSTQTAADFFFQRLALAGPSSWRKALYGLCGHRVGEASHPGPSQENAVNSPKLEDTLADDSPATLARGFLQREGGFRWQWPA